MGPKRNKEDFQIRKKTGEVIERKPGFLDGSDFAIRNCVDCEIYVCDHLAQVFVDDCKNCKVFIGPTKGSIFLRDSQDIQIFCAAQQFRVSDCTNVVACVFSQSDPALENVKNLLIAPYNFVYPQVEQHFKQANLDLSQDKWSQVFDFTPNKTERNWSILDPSQYQVEIRKEFEGIEGELVNPVPRHVAYGGTLQTAILVGSQDPACKEESDGMMAFSINVKQDQAAQQFHDVIESHQQQQEIPQIHHQPEQEYEEQQLQQSHQQSQQESQNQWQQPQYQDYEFFEGTNQNESTHVTNVSQSNTDVFQSQVHQSQSSSQIQSQELSQIQRIQEIRDREHQEKTRRREEARLFLENFQKTRARQIQAQKQQNRDLQSAKLEDKKKLEQGAGNPWKFVTQNIPMKAGEYPGKKDVTRMRESIFNKSVDDSKK